MNTILWHERLEQAAAKAGLTCTWSANTTPSVPGSSATVAIRRQSEDAILWNTDRRPLFVTMVAGNTLRLVAMVLQPGVEFVGENVFSRNTLISMKKIAVGIAYMIGKSSIEVGLRKGDIQAASVFIWQGDLPDSQLLHPVIWNLMVVQNIFRQFLNGELNDLAFDYIASHYSMSKLYNKKA